MSTLKRVARARAKRAAWSVAGLSALLLCGSGHPAFAQSQQPSAPAGQQVQPGPAAAPASDNSGFLSGLGVNGQLLGNMWGLRPFLGEYGMTFTLQETSEVLGNVTGGFHTGFTYDGLTTATLQLDTQRAFGWHGGTFDVSALQIHGRNLSVENLGTLQTASGIEADRATRLWELWYDQKFLDGDWVDLKIGQQSLDQEFITSQNAALYVNTAFGWPAVPSLDLPGGGPAYPLSALGVRLRAHPSGPLTVLAGVFNGNPAPTTVGDPQQTNPSGTSFPLNGGTLAIAELQFSFPSTGGMTYPGQSAVLPGTYKIGFWYDSESFADQRFDNTGLSLANPASTGIPQQHSGDYSLYAVADQTVWQDSDDPGHTLSLFTRIMGTPETNRNLLDFGLNAGVNLKAPLPGRDSDTLGLAMGYVRVSPRVAGLDRDSQFYTGAFTPVRGGETYIEATYQYAATSWLQLQPDLQYVFNPGGGIANANGTARVANELVLGVRTNITF